MSPRAIRRANARRLARERRREELRLRRAGIVASAILSAAAFGAPPAQGANFAVTNTADAGAGSLRDAIAQANAADGDDTITIDPLLTGTIRLTSGSLSIAPSTNTDKTTIVGPGRTQLRVSGDANNNGTPDSGDTHVFDIDAPGSGSAVSISGLTITNGYDDAAGSTAADGGGAINVATPTPLTLTDVAVTGSRSDNNRGGGGILVNTSFDKPLTLVRTTVSGNVASAGGGGGIVFGTAKYGLGQVVITDSTITGNTAKNGGGIYGSGPLTMSGSTVSGNTATDRGGGMFVNAKYGATSIKKSVISGNTAAGAGGGVFLASAAYLYSTALIQDTTIAGNQGVHGAGIDVGLVLRGNRVVLDRTTISGNTGTGASSFGGGLLIDYYSFGHIQVLSSTISGNTAAAGAGVSLGSDVNRPLQTKYTGTPRTAKSTGTIDFDNSTIASNSASQGGAGIYLGQYDSISTPTVKKSGTATLRSTIVADNLTQGITQDLYRPDTSTSGGFAGRWSLIEQPGSTPLTQLATLTLVDPQLLPLADNGGLTRTQLLAGTSPAIDQGRAAEAVTTDQRGQPRTVETGIGNPLGGDGTDMGAVELPKSAVVLPPEPVTPAPPTPGYAVLLRGVPLGGTRTPLLVAGSTPVACNATVETISSCVIEVRAASGRATSVAAGALLASGGTARASGKTHLQTGARLTRAGRAALRHRPLGLEATATVFAGAKDPLTRKGKVRLLAVPWFTLPVAGRSPELSDGVLAQLRTIAVLIARAKSATCTAYTDRGRNDVHLTQAQAKAACAELADQGFKGTLRSVGAGHARPIAAVGAAANRRIVVRFRF